MECSAERNEMYKAIYYGDYHTIHRLIVSHGVEFLENWRKGYGLLNLALNLKIIPDTIPGRDVIVFRRIPFFLDLDRNNVHTYNFLLNRPSDLLTENRRYSLIQSLLLNGVNVNAASESNWTPLHTAAKFNYAICLKLLLEFNANVNLVTDDNKTALDIAVEQGGYDSVQFLLKHCTDWKNKCNPNLLRVAITSIHSNNDVVRALLNYGFTSNDEDLHDCQMFYSAIKKDCIILVKHLLHKGFDANKSYRLSEELIIPLHAAVKWAVKGNCLFNVELLLQYGANPTAVNDENETVLRVAVKHGSFQLVQLLLRYCSDFITEDNADLLRVALFNQSKFVNNMVQDLMNYGFTLSDQDVTSDMFFRAVDEHCTLIVEELLKRGFEVNKSYRQNPSELQDLKRVIPLHYVVTKKLLPEAKLLIDHGADVNACDDDGKTAIYYLDINNFLSAVPLLGLLLENRANPKDVPELLLLAIKHSKMEIAERLLQLNIGVHYKTSAGHTSLYHAVDRYRHFETSEKFHRYRYRCWSCAKNPNDASIFIRVIRLLLQKGADVNAKIPHPYKDETDVSVIHIAASLGDKHSQLLEMLLEFHADVNACCGETSPLLICILNGYDKCFRLFLEKGVDATAKLADGKTYLHLAAISESPKNKSCKFFCFEDPTQYPDSHPFCLARESELDMDPRESRITKELVNLGVDINVKDQHGKTALHYAAINIRGGKIMKRFIANGADWLCRDNDLRTPLHCAAMESLFQNVSTLVMFGADINCRDVDGCTPLHTLVIERVEDASKLLEFGSDINMTNNDGLTPFEIVFHAYKQRLEEKREAQFEFSTTWDFTRHILKLSAAGLSVNPKNLAVLTKLCTYIKDEMSSSFKQDRYKEISNGYLGEVALLKQKRIGNSNVTYYSLLTSTRNKLVKLAKNKKLVQVLIREFPIFISTIYASELRLKVLYLKQVPRRESLLADTMQAIRNCIIHVPEFELMLPDHLSDDDLESLVRAHLPQRILLKDTRTNSLLPFLNDPREEMPLPTWYEEPDLMYVRETNGYAIRQ